MIRSEMSLFRVGVCVLALLSGMSLVANGTFAGDAENAESGSDLSEASAPSPPGTLEFIGENLLMEADGTFHDWRVVESSVDPALLSDAFAVVEVSLTSLDTGIEKRDDHLRNPDFFEVETYPLATVRIHSPQPIEDDSAEHPRFAVQFDVDLHGVQKTVVGEISMIGASPLIFEGALTIDRLDFGIGPTPGFWSPMVPKAEIPVRFRVEL